MKIESYRHAVVMISGAASGFGRLVAEKLGDCEARLVLGDINEPGLAEVASMLEARGVQVVAARCDVSVESDVASLVQKAVHRFGRLDVGINNAGILGKLKRLIDIDERHLDVLYAVNVKGVFFGMKHQIRQMLGQDAGGRVLNVSSVLGVGAAPGGAAYAASKHAVIGLTKTAALEYGRSSIRVNAICPFLAETPMLRELVSEDPTAERVMASASPMRRSATAEEIVDVMLMICARENSFMNGQAIVVDGGASAA